MEIKWYGHSCFLLKDSNGVSVLTDPFSPEVLYELPMIKADAVTVSHNHNDHNYLGSVEGSTILIRTPDEFYVHGVRIRGFKTYHDNSKGAARGGNVMFTYDMDGIRILHCGDLGEIPDRKLLDSLDRIDILLVPIGAIYTIDDLQARELANILKPGIVIPMHYKNSKLKFELCPLDPFIEGAKDCEVYKMSECEATITKDSLGTNRVIVLRPFDPSRDK